MSRDKFNGQWNVNEDGTLTEPAQYTMVIENGTETDQVLIWNFQNHFTEVVRGVCKADSFFIPLQTFANGDRVEGWGTIKDKNPFNYTYQPNAYQHADMTLFYQVSDSLGQVNAYGLGGGLPSIWSK
ncbi:MAG: hypothetical protein JNJ58_06360 [Chitinophagaceae bacterium]|nr:hypothetical protein [Chitinophagaceae bacterium]